MENLSPEEVLSLLDWPKYFRLQKWPLPGEYHNVISMLARDHLIVPSEKGAWSITNLGALLFANDLREFRKLIRKAVRVVRYEGKNNVAAVSDQTHFKGYACGFEDLITFISAQIPSREVIGRARRQTTPMLPSLAVRELVANALVHQDVAMLESGPLFEIFSNRIVISNPGKPLVSVDRFVDTPPQARNRAMVSLMQRLYICEDRGSGIDKVVFELELNHLPAPLFEDVEVATRATLFGGKTFAEMDTAERVRACYFHACLCYVRQEPMTNASVRKRFGLGEKKVSQVSKLLKKAVTDGWIVLHDPKAGAKHRRYRPFWDSPRGGGFICQVVPKIALL